MEIEDDYRDVIISKQKVNGFDTLLFMIKHMSWQKSKKM